MALTRHQIIAFCASYMAQVLINSAFNFYYVKIFMNYYHIEEKWFQTAQVLFLIWNTLNDPLFAYVQDNASLTITKTRRESILYCGPLFAMSFLIPWIPWGDSSWIVGLHLIVTLFLWDTMYTFVGLAMSALFTEISQEQEDRVKLTRYAQVASLLGSPSVMILEFTSNSLHNLTMFRITAFFIACASALLFRYTGRNSHTKYDIRKADTDVGDSVEKNGQETYWQQTRQIFCDRNFLSFVVTNFCHQFHLHFLNSFTAIVCDQLISDDVISINVRKMFYGGMSIAATFVVILGAPLIQKFSYYTVIRCSYVCAVASGILMYCIGQDHPWCLMFFLLVDSCITNSVFALFNMPLADIADDNKKKYKRNQPISSMIFGTNALITKPAISLSPMLAVAVLNSFGYSEMMAKSLGASAELKQTMFLLVCFYPIVLGTIQSLSWSYFSIKHETK